jgi:hypothetical protein
MYTVLWKLPSFQSCGILRHPQRAISCEAACPFTEYGAHSALMGDEGTGSFYLLILQIQHYLISIIVGSIFGWYHRLCQTRNNILSDHVVNYFKYKMQKLPKWVLKQKPKYHLLSKTWNKNVWNQWRIDKLKNL